MGSDLTYLVVAGLVALLLLFGFRAYVIARKRAAIRIQAEKVAERQRRRRERSAALIKEVVQIEHARFEGDVRPVVMVVDDSMTWLETMRRILEDRQFRVVSAVNGREAWTSLQKIRPNLIVSDIDMPYMDGFDLLRLIRSDVTLADIPVILVTADAPSLLRARDMKGVDGLLSKPFNDDHLIGSIAHLLQVERAG